MRYVPFFLSAALVLSLFSSYSSLMGESDRNDKPEPVEFVDLERYAGLWYEIAKIPNRFQKKCSGGATALYTLREDGKIDVVNRCNDKNGKTIEAKGLAKVVDKISNARLKVSFVKFLGFRMFWGDYWVLGLGDEYEYAIVGTPNRKYGWILSRQPSLPQDVIHRLFQELRQQGYDPDDFEMSTGS